MIGVVYVITNSKNGMRYVGVTTKKSTLRFKQHVKDAVKCGSRMFLHRAIRKYGPDAFSVQDVETCETREQLLQAEIHWIAELETFSPGGYNMTRGGEGTVGRKTSEEERKRVSERFKGKKQSAEHIEKGRLTRIGRQRSEETKRKIGAAHRGKKLTEEQKNKLRLFRSGFRMPDSAVEKLSRPVIAAGERFGSLSAAAEALGVSAATVSRRINKGVEGYRSLSVVRRRAKRTAECVEEMRKRVSIPVVIDGVRFSSMEEAAAEIGMTRPGVAYRIRTGHPGYSLAE